VFVQILESSGNLYNLMFAFSEPGNSWN